MNLTNFSDLGLNPELLKALEAEGYTKPTPIQAQAIPRVLAGRDLLGIAQTGTGKTAAFALPILHRLAADRAARRREAARVLVLSPTRELASQIAESFRTYGKHSGLPSPTMFGGVGHRPQVKRWRAASTCSSPPPAASSTTSTQRSVLLGVTEVLVLDEADQMLDMGFIKPHPPDRLEAVVEAPEPVLLGDHAAGDRRARRRDAARSLSRRRGARRQDGRPRRAERDPRRAAEEARAAASSCSAIRR